MKRLAFAASAVLLAVVLAGCTPSESEVRERARHVQEQSWEAMGYDGPIPNLSASTIGLRVAEVVVLSDKIVMEGSSAADCVSLAALFEALFMAEFPDAEQQSYLEALTASLSHAISGCEDGRWNDAMVDVAEAGILADAYTTKFKR